MDNNLLRNIERNLLLSNSIDKTQQPIVSINSKLLRVKPVTIAPKKQPEKPKKPEKLEKSIIINKAEKVKPRKSSGEKVQKNDAKYIPEISDDKMRKLKIDKSSSNHSTDNSIDKTAGRSALMMKTLKPNYQNLKTSTSPTALSNVLSVSSMNKTDEYNYEVCLL